jgi:hypothetical protein
MQAGEPVLSIEPQQELRQQAEGVIDWLNAETPSNLRMTWEDAVEAQKEWHSEITRASRVTELTPEQAEGLVTIKEYADGYKWVDVQTEVCLKHEGTMMGHCVGQGGYTQGVKEGKTKIISLRDTKGLAHATIEGVSENPISITPELMDQNVNQLDLFDKAEALELSGMEVHQIKGKENKGVPAKYRDYVQDFLTTFQVHKFSTYGLSDLENSGLYKLRKGGYGTVEQVGKKMTTNPDSTSWWRVGNEKVELKDYNKELAAKWKMLDKGGRGMGEAIEQHAGVIDTISFGYNENRMKYQEHVKALFALGLKPGEQMYQEWGGLQRYGLAVGKDGKTVGEPQEVGEKIADIDSGTVYQTKEIAQHTYWLMHGDHIVSHFEVKQALQRAGQPESANTILVFDKSHGIPGGSMSKFLDEVQQFTGETVVKVQIQGRALDVDDITWKPGPNDEEVMERDDVKYYVDQTGHTEIVRAIDSHGHLLFIMDAERANFTPVMVSDPKVAGFYAIYLIDDMNVEIGEYDKYDSFARELLDETGWFKSDQYRNNDEWRVMDDDFPILYTMVEWDTDGENNTVRDKEEETMSTFWNETSLDGSGMENDYFAGQYDILYNNGTVEWEDEHHPDEEGDTRASTDYYADGNGDVDTVTHPISGGTMRVTR